MTIGSPAHQEYEYYNPTPITSHTFTSIDLSAFGHGVIGVVVNAILAQSAGDGQVSSVQWGSAATGLSKAIETNAGDPNYKSEIWYLFDPAAENDDLVVNFSGNGVQGVHITLFYADSDATLSLGDTAIETTDQDPTLVSLTTNTAGALLISGYCTNDNKVATSSQTLMEDFDAGGNCAGSSYYVAGATSTYTMDWDRDPGGQGTICNVSGAEFYEPGGGTTPTIALDTADASAFTTDQPQVKFTGTDTEGDDLRYNVQISDRDTFVSGVTLDDSYMPGTQDGTIHPNPLASGLTWQGNIPVDDRPGQSFTAKGGVLDHIDFYADLGNDVAVDGTAYVRVYAHEGTYGTSSAPKDAPASYLDTPTPNWLAISDGNVYTYDALGYSWRTFSFTGANRIRLDPEKYYVAVLDWVPNDRDYDNAIAVRGSSDLGHDGNCWLDGQSAANYGVYSGVDLFFRVYTDVTTLDKVSGTDAGFENLDTPADTDPFNSGDAAAFTVQAADALGNGDYFWRARVKDPADTDTYSSWATTRTFDVVVGATVSPVIVSIALPAVAATYQEQDVAAVSPVTVPIVLPSVTASYTQAETASVSPLTVPIVLPSVTAGVTAAFDAAVSPVTVPISLPGAAATYQELDVADVNPVTVPINLPTVTASGASGAVASVSPVTVPVVLPSVTATYQAELTASVPPVGVVITTPAITAAYQELDVASVSPIAITISIPAVTASGASGSTAAVSPVTVPISLPAVTATYQGVWAAAVAPTTVAISPRTVSAAYTSTWAAGVAPVTVTIALPSVSAVGPYTGTQTLTLRPRSFELTLPDRDLELRLRSRLFSLTLPED